MKGSKLIGLLILGFVVSCSSSKEQISPNILLIVADDLGYGDLGCYGGDIETPNIDALAEQGIRFSHFHTAPMCAPSRAMLLSGNDNHIAGIGKQGKTSEDFGYEGMLSDRIVTIPNLLHSVGYHTFMAGKWHLGKTPEANPHQKGFMRSFALIDGAGNHYSNTGVLKPEFSTYTEDGDSTTWIKGAYSTDFYTDKLLAYMEEAKISGKPFFAYAAYTSPHWPLQVDEKYWKKYRDRYNEGYEALRKSRLESLKTSGMISKNAEVPKWHESVIPWDSLSEEEQKVEARKMELYAGMVDNLDENIGRLITYLKETDQYQNTFIVFMSDNGAAYRDFIKSDNYPMLRERYSNKYENMGKADSYVSYGPQWAEAGSAPFRYYKDYATEGGMNTTLILSGMGVGRSNYISNEFLTVMDLAPTFYELANVSYPETFKGRKLYPLKGEPLSPFLSGKAEIVHDSSYVFAFEHTGNAMVRIGDWKITNFIQPFEEENFGLYNMSSDLGEQIDLKEMYPEKFNELMNEWNKYVNETKLKLISSAVD